MPCNVISHEGRDEIIAVIIARLHPQRQRDPGIGTGLFEQLRLQLLCEELIGITLINKGFDLMHAGESIRSVVVY